MLYFQLGAAGTADDVMVVIPGNFVSQVPVARMRRTRQTDLRQKFERTVHGRFRESGQLLFCLSVHVTWREMRPGMMQHMQDRKTLRRHPIAAGAKLWTVFRSTGHRNSYCKFLQ